MGFGTLFFGYFLILAIGYYSFTDIISALIMTFAFYKLSGINRAFKLSSYSAILFSVFGLGEFIFAAYEMFFAAGTDFSNIYSYISAARHLFICTLSILMLMGMRDVSNEVGLKDHAKKCQRIILGTFVIYLISICLETDFVFGWLDMRILSVLILCSILSKLFLTIAILLAIFYCYSHIVMPDQNKEEKPRESRFAFVNAHRKHVEEKQREYAEYKLNKLAQRRAKEKNKNEKKK